MESDSEEFEDFDIEDLKPRAYQLELLEKATKSNIISFLDTGTGKTLIALLLIKETLGRSVFLAPKRILVKQQSLAATNIGITNQVLMGESTELWDFSDWQKCLIRVQALFMTPELFLNALRSGYITMQNFKLLIFDECHHCSGNDPYSKIMNEFYHVPHPYRPKILGLTASPVGTGSVNYSDLRIALQDLCNILDCSFVQINRSTVNSVANDPKYFIEGVEDTPVNSSNLTKVFLGSMPNNISEESLINHFISKNGSDILKLLGPKALQLVLRDISKKVESPSIKSYLLSIDLASEFSNRFLYLVEILKKHFEQNGGQVIVLVQKRIITWYLTEALNAYSTAHNLEIKAEKLIGKMTRKLEMGLLKSSDLMQKEAVQDFKNGKFNVLICTTVAEEGIDIPACDLVIRFDSVSDNLISYVQSKGRARDQCSKFVILTEKEKKKQVEEKLKKFDEAVKFLKEIADTEIGPVIKIKHLACFEVPSEDLGAMSYETQGFQVTGAKVCENWSMQFIENFCKELNKNKYSRYEPIYTVKHVRPGDGEFKTEFLRPGYHCFLKFPKILEIGEVASINIHQKEIKAKQDAALQGVRVLYERKLLNKHLKPYWLVKSMKSEIKIEDPDIEFVDEKGTRVRPKKKVVEGKTTTLWEQDLYFFNIIGTVNAEYFVYTVECEPGYPSESELRMGVLAPVMLETCPFTAYPYNIFKYSGIDLHTEKHKDCRNCEKFPVKINVKLVQRQKFAEEDLRNMKLFHLIINAICKGQYQALLTAYTEKPLLFNTNEIPVLFISMKNSGIDYTTMEQIVNCFIKDAGSFNSPCGEFIPGNVIKSKHLNDFFIYLRTVPEGVDYEFEDKHYITTIKSYFQQKYKINLASSTTLEVKSIGSYKQAIRPRITGERISETVFIPLELCQTYPLPTSLILWCKLSPNIFHKLNQFFLCSSLKTQLNLSLSLNYILESITCGSSLESKDYQRLEILGDSALKLISSEYLYKNYPKALEGMLTNKRMLLTSNDTLFKKALEMKLYKYMQAKVFTIKYWKPQGLEKILSLVNSEETEEEFEDYNEEVGFDKILDEEGEVRIEARKEVVDLSNKQLADCVEAIIGGCYLCGGIEMAGNFIAKALGFQVIKGFVYSRESSRVKLDIGYEFKNPGLLREALTHSTAKENFDYNRLEFLGDAIIDFVVLEHLFLKFPKAGPGSLSKMKATAVSNRTFSYISHKLGLANFLVFNSSELNSDLKKYKENADKLLNSSKISTLQDSGMKVMADLFESVTAAIYLDSLSLSTTKSFILTHLSATLSALNPENSNLHPHNRLFDYGQRHKKTLGSFRIERFKVHKKSDFEFITKIYIQDKVVAEGRGSSKLESSENAAELFFSKFPDN